MSNVEKISEDFCRYRDMPFLPYQIRKDNPIWFQGSQGAFLFNIDEVYHVNRVLPYDTTARNYWGEFRRNHKMIPRLTKMVEHEVDCIVECSFLEPVNQDDFNEYIENSYEFTSYVLAQFDKYSFHGVSNSSSAKRVKTWNLTNDRFLGPNLKDYSINDCYKYYTLL